MARNASCWQRWSANGLDGTQCAADEEERHGQQQSGDGRPYRRQGFIAQWRGQAFHGLGYMGYDNITGKHFSSLMDDASTSLFVAHDDYDPATKTHAYAGEMNDPMQGGAKVPYRSTLRVVSNDKHVMEMCEARNGKEAKTMQIEYTRAAN